ncbi:MAG: P83/100 family protein [Spirochaetota bacterium]|nr:P83/100 family protein [Spirochaetota bacterium]
MKKILIIIVILNISLNLFAQKVVKEELFKVKRESVEFVNYEGPHDKFETADQIRGIGSYIGRFSESSNNVRTYNGRYSITHLIAVDGEGLLNADIFSIEKNAVVDHINNVRRILSGYLEQAYSYSREDSDILAEFATYYNAVYRGDFQYFISSYNKIVIDNLKSDRAGISTRYLEWPGNTQMVIPLDASGELRIDTDIVSNKEVIEDLRTQDDKGIEPRKDIVELKEREIEEEQDKIEEQKEQLKEEKMELESDKEELKKETDSLEDGEIEKRESEILEKEEELKDREDKQQERQEEVKKERELISEDEKQIIEEEKGELTGVESEAAETVPFLLIDGDDSDLMGRLALINTKTGEIYKQSSINTVRGRKYYLSGDKLLIVTGIDRAPQAVRLMFLDSKTLEVLIQGNYDVFSDTDLLLDGKNIYAVVKENDSWYVGRFNHELVLQARSGREVLSYTPLQLNNRVLYVQLKDGKVVALNPDTLKIDE